MAVPRNYLERVYAGVLGKVSLSDHGNTRELTPVQIGRAWRPGARG